MKLSFTRENGQILQFQERKPGLLLYGVLPDGQNPEHNFTIRWVAPDPAVELTGGIDRYKETMRRSPFTEPWQWFAVDLLSLAMYNKLHKDLSKTERSFIISRFKGMYAGNAFITNAAGVDRYSCYPCGGTDAKRGSDPKIDPLLCVHKPGSTRGIQVLEVRKNAKGVSMARINGFRHNSTPPKPDLGDPRVGWATIIEASGKISNFGHLGGRPVPYPIIQFEPCWYPMRGLARIG
jgi:hypothetical protein